jgi:UDP-2,4-diacetamido-2,4,6-trideoxy-beta-L-altropyranose hydrolase
MIVIVCDATQEIGYGHLKRCLVLASFYRKLGLPVTFLMREAAPAVKDILKSQGMGWVVRSDHGECSTYLLEKKDQITLVILDHYKIDADFEKHVFGCFPVMVVDDLCRPHWCDVLVDQTVNRKVHDYENKLYNRSAQTLLGIEYALMDPVYKGVKTNGDKTNILITFGATDPGNAVLRVLDILEHAMEKRGIVFHVPLSSMSPCLDGLKKQISKSRLDIRLYIDLPDLCSLYERCGIAIGAPGTSLLERIYCGLINITIVVAPNQREVSQNIARKGAVVCLGEMSTLDASLFVQTLTRMIDSPGFGDKLQTRAMELVDGKGAVRIIKKTLPLIAAQDLRPATNADLEILYKWQHEPGARQYSRNTTLPTGQEHQDWFATVLSRKDVRLSIIEWCRMQIGYIRLDSRGEKQEISVLIAQKFQGYGFAKRALLKILKEAAGEYTAVVYPENKVSIGLFESAGFYQRENGEYVFNTRL